MKTVRVARLDERGIIPRRKNPTDAGMDFFAPYDVLLKPHEAKIVRTFITVEVPEGYMLLLKPKGKNKHLVGAGVVDAYYQPGEILIRLVNPTDETIIIKRGDGIAQGIFIPIETPKIIEVSPEELTEKIVKNRSGKGGIIDEFISENKSE